MTVWYGAPYPKCPHVSQFDDPTPDVAGNRDGNNCTMASGARMLLYGFGVKIYPGALRNLQGDQEGGTDLSDLAVAWKKVTGVPLEYGKVTWAHYLELLRMGYLVTIQFDYGELPEEDRVQKNFLDGHASTTDGYRLEDDGSAYIRLVDTIARGTTYAGRYVEAWKIKKATGAIAGLGFVLAAWVAKEEPMVLVEELEHYEAEGRPFRIAAGTTVAGYNPRERQPVVSRRFAEVSGARATSRVRITQQPDTSRAPHGTFLRVKDGTYAGLYIEFGPGISVGGAPEVPAPTEAAIEAARVEGQKAGLAAGTRSGYTRGRQAVLDAAQAVPETLPE